MDFLILIGQRKCRYAEQYAPEALEVIDEYGNDENPDFLVEKMAEYKKTNEFDSLAVVRIRVMSAAITEALYPASKAIAGTVVSRTPSPGAAVDDRG